jgi:hypothetical protein
MEQTTPALWDAFFDHRRTSWYKISHLQIDQPAALPNAVARFEQLWVTSRNQVFCEYDGVTVRWNYERPQLCRFE